MTRLGPRHSDVPTLASTGLETGATRSTGPKTGPARSAFTVIELLTVVAVIAILLTIVLVVGSGVLTDQRAKMTRNVLTNLDRALDEYVIAVGSIPGYGVKDAGNNLYRDVPGDDNNVQAYGTGTNNLHCARPDAAVFIRQTKGFGEVDAIITGIPDRFLRLTMTQSQSGSPTVESDTSPSVVDAWAADGWPLNEDGDRFSIALQQVIYYVHPDNTLAQDLYGQCLNRRPYFMSAGPDTLYGLTNEPPRPGATIEEAESFTKDNIYSYQPGPIREDMSAREWSPE